MENKAVLFTNITDKDFYHTWNKVTYKFKAHKSQYLEYYLAYHFAKHLAYRELGAEKFLEKDIVFQNFINRCIKTGDEPEELDETKLHQDVLNKNLKQEIVFEELNETSKS
jgi:hypothetical protein